jgi:hypothetical protein
MIRNTGDMFSTVGNYGYLHALLVTTNSYIRRDGALVMGRGAARTAALRWPGLPYELGKRIEHLSEYNIGLLSQTNEPRFSIGAFQVKFNFADAADLDLIARSANELAKLATERHDWRFDMNYPGIGNGRLSLAAVDPLLESLPDNVHIWTFT